MPRTAHTSHQQCQECLPWLGCFLGSVYVSRALLVQLLSPFYDVRCVLDAPCSLTTAGLLPDRWLIQQSLDLLS
jgi:hypothetical protein